MKKSSSIQIDPLGNIPLELDRYFASPTIEKAAQLFEQMERPLIGGVQTAIDLRNLNNWIKVLNENPNNVRGKKFTFIEFIWIKVIEQLRDFNVGFDLITNFKSELFKPLKIKGVLTSIQHAKNYIEDLGLQKEQKKALLQFINAPDTKTINEITLTVLHLCIVDSILNKLPVSFAIFQNGTYQILYESKKHLYTEDEKSRLLNDTYLTISISTILKKFFMSDLSNLVVPKLDLLSYAENKFYEVMNSGDYVSIIVNFKDKKIKPLEFRKDQNVKEHIIDILDKKEYEDILVKKAKGVITKIENRLKVTL